MNEYEFDMALCKEKIEKKRDLSVMFISLSLSIPKIS